MFAGIGGFRLGLEQAGMQCIGGCEINEIARKVYKKNFSEYPTDADVRNVDARSIPDFNILCAGFPCQAFSVAGKRLGFNDTRGTLFFEIARVAKEKRPEILFLENVEGLLNHDKGSTFGTILLALAELGYDVEWQVVNGKYFVPQNRRRVFIIGHNRDKPSREIFPIKEDDKINELQKIEIDKDVFSFTEQRTEEAKAIRRESQKSGRDWCPRRAKVLAPRTDGKVNCLTAVLSREHILQHNDRKRWLTPLEFERLMGFPDGWTDIEGMSDNSRYRTLGNAVIPKAIRFVGESIKSALDIV